MKFIQIVSDEKIQLVNIDTIKEIKTAVYSCDKKDTEYEVCICTGRDVHFYQTFNTLDEAAHAARNLASELGEIVACNPAAEE